LLPKTPKTPEKLHLKFFGLYSDRPIISQFAAKKLLKLGISASKYQQTFLGS
jgi:hypothetical protein